MVTTGVSSGAGLTEAQPSTSPSQVPSVDQRSTASLSRSSASSKRNGKGNSAQIPTGKLKQSRKAKGRVVLQVSDEDTDDDDRRQDDRIKHLISLGYDLNEIDRLYCNENLSAGDVERLLTGSLDPTL